MRARFLLGPAGSGKTFRCLAEARHALAVSPDGAPLVLLAPRQSTFQVERQLLAEGLPGFTRLHILSFERLANLVLDRLQRPVPNQLDDEGRVMVLRGLLARHRQELHLFRASARLTGFARELSEVLGEFQQNQTTAQALRQAAAQLPPAGSLPHKLLDLATMLEKYLVWLNERQLHDADSLLDIATHELKAHFDRNTRREPAPILSGEAPSSPTDRSSRREEAPSSRANRSSRREEAPLSPPHSSSRREEAPSAPDFHISHLWIDGFAEFSQRELDFLLALFPFCAEATLALCLEEPPKRSVSWLSNWSLAAKTFEKCQKRFAATPGIDLRTEVLPRDPPKNRYPAAPALRHLEQHWSDPTPFPQPAQHAIRLVRCYDPEGEAIVAAREILRHVRAGGRYREASVLVRSLEGYHDGLHRVFARYGIPFFLDRRESVAHHPLAELTSSALRTIAFDWTHEDWFAALKTGLSPVSETEIDRLENEALARGWEGAAWQKPIVVDNEPDLTSWLATLQDQLLRPFKRLNAALAATHQRPTGPQLATALRQLWDDLRVESQLERWAAADPSAATGAPSVHATVWDQMNAWLRNVELAFANDALPLRDWLPILEAGLGGLTVGVIPPALDQVLIGAIDRSRNPEIRLALVLGLNETVFPAPPRRTALLSDSDREALEARELLRGSGARDQLSRERFLGYIACTRPSQRLVATFSTQDANGSPLNPSPFVAHLRQLFPSLQLEAELLAAPADYEHTCELIEPFLQALAARPAKPGDPSPARHAGLLKELPDLAAVVERVANLNLASPEPQLTPALAQRLYGPALRTSVSRIEQFAACPFRFFVHSGLRAEERKLFELDAREQGTFQHEVLAQFHRDLRARGQRWRDITPAQARERIATLAQHVIDTYRDGLLRANEQSRFTARVLTHSLQDFVETLIGWIRGQYRFDPVEVELPFGNPGGPPPWALDLGGGHKLEMQGRIDRIDLCPSPEGDAAFCVVLDYKSSYKQLDPVLLEHGLQLQLLAYLNVLRAWPDPGKTFGVPRLIPAGVFYVNLRGRYENGPNRAETLAGADDARRAAYRHTGRFDLQALPLLDSRPDAKAGDQFNYRLTKAGKVYAKCSDPLPTDQFQALLQDVENHLRRMGGEIYAGTTRVDPFKKGRETACDQCDYAPICRIDPWTHPYRVLRKSAPANP